MEEIMKNFIDYIIATLKESNEDRQKFIEKLNIFKNANNLFTIFYYTVMNDIDVMQSKETINKIANISWDVLKYVNSKDSNVFDEVAILFYVLQYVIESTPDIIEINDYFNKKLLEEGIYESI